MAYNLYKPVITLEAIIMLKAFGDSISLRPNFSLCYRVIYRGDAFMIKGW